MTIINCFINSSIPPALQIDIPVEQAQKIIEHRKELGPYVFREAQVRDQGMQLKHILKYINNLDILFKFLRYSYLTRLPPF